jgi:hypothetical protein
MSRIQSICAVLALTAIVALVPQAQAQTVRLAIAGSTAIWQTAALGAYNGGSGIAGTAVPPMFHYTSASKFNLNDSRPAGGPVTDTGLLWIVWDSAATPNVWLYANVDSVVGDRCYFAVPKCTLSVSTFPGISSPPAIETSLWGDGTLDQVPPASIQALFTAGSVPLNAAATDIRPEDAAFADCRANSPLGASTVGGGASDGLDGLGYSQSGATQGSGQCPAFISGNPAQNALNGWGHAIQSGYPASTSKSNVVTFALTGKDPITGSTIPAYTVYPVGATPIVFVFERDKGQLTNLANASEIQLQQVFSGTTCDASALGQSAGGINIFVREPMSGTYNTTESNVMRRPIVYPNPVLGLSMESNVNAPANNWTLNGYASACVNNPSGNGARYRAIGTGEEVKSVLNSGNSGVAFATHQDGIGFTFFSYGNVSTIANNANYGYLALNGVDPIFQTYGSTIDPGQPATAGVLPAEANLPSTCFPTGTQFPCAENAIWKNGFSFPNLRNGTYRAWSLVRFISTGTAGTQVSSLVKASQKYAVTSVPDFVPFAATTASVNGVTISDVGLKVLRSHYPQRDGHGLQLGAAGAAGNNPEKGGDMGGYIIPTTIGVTTYKQTCLIQNATSDNNNLGPVERPDTGSKFCSY